MNQHNRTQNRARFAIGRVLGLGVLTTSLLTAFGTPLFAQGNYAPVTADDVIAMKFNHYYTPEKKAHDADFEWTFTEQEFVVKKAKGSIPGDLLEKLLPKDMQADEIRGEWKVEKKDGLMLILTKIKVGGEKDKEKKDGLEEAAFNIYRTAPTVIRVGEPQYVFGLLH